MAVLLVVVGSTDVVVLMGRATVDNTGGNGPTPTLDETATEVGAALLPSLPTAEQATSPTAHSAATISRRTIMSVLFDPTGRPEASHLRCVVGDTRRQGLRDFSSSRISVSRSTWVGPAVERSRLVAAR